jgi:hypothetical protein
VDAERIDSLARSLAGPRTRRSAIKTIAGTLLGFGVVATTARTAFAQAGEGEACTEDADCAGDAICCAEACRSIECCIDEPDPNARCPEGTSCFEGVCDPLGTNGCSTDAGCPEGQICCEGACHEIECCIADADPNARCPEGTTCFEGVCDPVGTGVDLPETGVGTATDSNGLWAFGTAAAAAALVGGAALRRQSQPEQR